MSLYHICPIQIVQHNSCARSVDPATVIMITKALHCIHAIVMTKGRHVGADFPAPFAGANAQGSHHLVEAMKNAFAMRMQLGDPGPNNSFLNLDSVLADMLSTQFASQLRWVCWFTAQPICTSYMHTHTQQRW